MRYLISFFAISLSITNLALGESQTKRYLYNRRLGAFDLETEKIVWDKTLPGGCDRSSITIDGKKIYVPTGWWYSGEDSGFLVVNAENGELIKRIPVGPQESV